ncbi:MAG: hypothetical protein JRN52_11415 [Nitrososphaerota archaeon]|nr:hypothetical protein [Nitrososphaerota archaeon]
MKVHILGKGTIDLSIVSLEEIKPHEATIPSFLSSIERDMKRTGFQRDPILIDRKTHMALDGMHRRQALASLRAKYAICSEFDYFDQSVKLERWLRYLVAPNLETVKRMISMFHMKKVRGIGNAIKAVDSRKSGFAILNRRSSFVSQDVKNIFEVYQKLEDVDQLCEQNQVEISFASDKEKLDLYSSESVFVLYPAPLHKSDVVAMVKRSSVFPCKTTRHIVPLRPMGVYFPLDMLVHSSKRICERELKRIVKLSNVVVEEQDVWYEGRRYSEPIAVFRKHS